LLAATVFYGYTQLSSLKAATKEEQKKICIKLGKLTTPQALQTNTTPQKKASVKKVVEEKKETPPKKKETPKPKKIKKEPKKPVVKKAVVKKKPPKKKPVVKKVPPKKKEKMKKVEEVPQPKETTEAKEQLQKEAEPEKPILQKSEEGQVTKKDCPQVCCNTMVSKAESYKNNNLAKIAKLLQENLYYPRRARKRGIEGKVVVRFRLLKDATVEDIEIVSSEHAILSRGAKKTIENLSGKFPRPEDELTLNVPINYFLLK
jgi:protein TonB